MVFIALHRSKLMWQAHKKPKVVTFSKYLYINEK